MGIKKSQAHSPSRSVQGFDFTSFHGYFQDRLKINSDFVFTCDLYNYTPICLFMTKFLKVKYKSIVNKLSRALIYHNERATLTYPGHKFGDLDYIN